MMTHSLRRTSPKGHAFLGMCIQCGMTNLSMKAIEEYCANPRGLTCEEVLKDAMQLDDDWDPQDGTSFS